MSENSEHELDELDFQILVAIRDWQDFLLVREGPRSSDFAKELGRARQSIEYRIPRLIGLALIEPAGSGEGKKVEYTLTPLGRRYAALGRRKLAGIA